MTEADSWTLEASDLIKEARERLSVAQTSEQYALILQLLETSESLLSKLRQSTEKVG